MFKYFSPLSLFRKSLATNPHSQTIEKLLE